ncbi:hypothetical protein BJF79_33490 [Actinomadura sp. CNU-125]|nr:hypothetical protein BJF79_33490 [Actinomadura sp. CNU-125]
MSGGEPLLRRDLAEIVASAHRAGVYTQLVTSGVGLTADRLGALLDAGLNSVQLSLQDARRPGSDLIAGRVSYDDKERAAGVIRAARAPFGPNVVLHRRDLDNLPEIIEVGARWGADRIELANAQFHGWALHNRAALMPTGGQLDRAKATVAAWRERHERPELVWVMPDHHEGVPKPCMGGWGARSITVGPDRTALPCPAAYGITDLAFPNVRDEPLARIWSDPAAFDAYRGTDWMTGPCRECPRREADFGGCRCQAHALTGDAARTDPACALSPDHHLVRRRGRARTPVRLPPPRRPPLTRSGPPARVAGRRRCGAACPAARPCGAPTAGGDRQAVRPAASAAVYSSSIRTTSRPARSSRLAAIEAR